MVLITVPTVFRSLRRITEPVVEPVSLFDAKAHLRLMPDFAEDDAYIQALIGAARRMTEDRTNRTWMLTRWQATFTSMTAGGCGGYELPRPPLVVDATHPVEIVYRDASGQEVTLPAEAVLADTDSVPGLVRLAESPPADWCSSGGVIRWWAGSQSPDAVDARATAAMKLLIGHLYANRQAVTTDGAGDVLPLAVDSLLASLSWSGAY